ncbi:MAG TPA: hypothetical protein VK533_15100 [Sphingomonas sp.]|uniref:hypothetical protein n=1 Tax=Sphingomonas sp. TaxID=28214 RepID=UPI002BE6F064|nr:hypothetical protein [Sphingomonas sp.]HMI20861.1 hypothetical protein [Sphingomonas sp.]
MIASKSWAFAALPLIAAIILLIGAPIYWPDLRGPMFLAVMALMFGEFMLIGWLINGRPAGAFIDNRNRISLSKLQAAAWTVVVLAGFATAAAFNIATAMYEDNSISALAIVIPNELLLAMGISATSLVAAPALLTLKSQQPEVQGALAIAKDKMGTAITSNGKLVLRDAPKDASWSDVVTGEEVGNAGSPDLGKIQQAAITLLLLGCYVAYVYADLAGSQETVTSLPTLDKSFVWLLGISHASYLAYKAAPHTT